MPDKYTLVAMPTAVNPVTEIPSCPLKGNYCI